MARFGGARQKGHCRGIRTNGLIHRYGTIDQGRVQATKAECKRLCWFKNAKNANSLVAWGILVRIALIKEEDGWLDDLPITVVLPDYLTTQGTTKKIQRELILEAIEAVKATTKFSSNAKMVDVEDCSHWIMWDRPKVIVDETMEMIKRADQHRKQSWGF